MKILIFLFVFVAHDCVAASDPASFEKKREEFRRYAFRILPDSLLNPILSDSCFGVDSSLIAWKKRPKGERSGYEIFFTDSSILRGKEYLNFKKGFLDSVYSVFGVHPEIIVAILRIESDFGTNIGEFGAVNTFFTLFSHFSRTEKTKTGHVKQFARLVKFCADWGVDPFSVKSSWAGALGIPQFMPASLNLTADGDGDGNIDIFYNVADAIYSIANFLESHGYRKNREKALRSYNGGNYKNAVFKYSKLISK